MHAEQALERLLEYADVRIILDVSRGGDECAARMRKAGRQVITKSLIPTVDRIFPLENLELSLQVDAVWMSHVLEHVRNLDDALNKAFQVLRPNGVLAVTVPPLKHEVVGGHINLFNAGILLYRLILAGFDCREARVGSYGYNISVLVRKIPATLPPRLTMDNGDIEKIACFFPCDVVQGFNGQLPNIRWDEADRPPCIQASNVVSTVPVSIAQGTYAWTSPYTSCSCERFYGKHHGNLLQDKVRNSEDLLNFALKYGKAPEVMLIENFSPQRSTITHAARFLGSDTAHVEDGFFPHYQTVHVDPLGFCWESSLPRLTFRSCTDLQRVRAKAAREAWRRLSAPSDLPEQIKLRFVLWPLQLIGDQVNKYGMNLSSWVPLIRHYRSLLPLDFQLVIKQHPRAKPSDLGELQTLVNDLPNTLLLPGKVGLSGLLSACTGVAGANSTVLYEARLMYGKPVWAYAQSWFTNHSELFMPLDDCLSCKLPNISWLEHGILADDERLADYANWFLAQLLARQINVSEFEGNPELVRKEVRKRSHANYERYGEDIWN